MADHKRRARRRLIGALLVAALVAGLAPLMLDEEARPLSQDLLIEIPSRSSIFSKIETLKPAPQESTPVATQTESAPKGEAIAQPESKGESRADAKSEPRVESKTEVKSEAKSEPRVESRNDVKSEAKSETKPETRVAPKAESKSDQKVDAPAANGRKSGGYLVQVGAYSRAESANSVKAKLIMGGHRVVVEVTRADDGTERHRVRIGPFASRDEALQVRDRAKAQGYEALLVTP